jgi:hypothetical protein
MLSQLVDVVGIEANSVEFLVFPAEPEQPPFTMDTSSDGVDPAKQQALERYREMKRKHGRLLAQNRHGGSHDTIWNSPFPTTSKYEICLFL